MNHVCMHACSHTTPVLFIFGLWLNVALCKIREGVFLLGFKPITVSYFNGQAVLQLHSIEVLSSPWDLTVTTQLGLACKKAES